MTAAADGAVLEQRLANLQRELTGYSGLLVAFSGGADSAFLLAAAVRASGEVLAATSTSESLASGEWAAAARFAAELGVEHVQVSTQELDRPGYTANGPDRCYHCKSVDQSKHPGGFAKVAAPHLGQTAGRLSGESTGLWCAGRCETPRAGRPSRDWRPCRASCR